MNHPSYKGVISVASIKKPKRGSSYKGKPTSLAKIRNLSGLSGQSRSFQGPRLSRLTIVWVQSNGVPFNTSGGFVAVLSRGGVNIATARFDNFGVAVFGSIATLTRVSYTLRIFSLNGLLFRTRFLPAGIEAYAVIG